MNQLVKIPEITSLPEVYQRFVNLRVGNSSIRELMAESPNSLKRAFLDLLTVSSFEAGSPMGKDETVLRAQTEALYVEFKGRFLELTLPEVKEAFNLGVRGSSGPYFGFCSKTYHQFLKHYIDQPERGRAWLAYLEETHKNKRVDKPIYYTEAQFKTMAIEAFKEYQKDGTMPPVPGYCALCYDFIKKSNGEETLIDRLDWDEIKELAKRSYSNDMNHGRRKSELLDLDYSISNRSFEFHIKKHGLRFYFDMLIKSGKELQL